MKTIMVGGHRVIVDSGFTPPYRLRVVRGYVYMQQYLYKVGRKSVNAFPKLHRFIMDAKPGQIVDHINRNPLDNRRSNLRLVTKQHSQWNRNVRGYSKINKGRYAGRYQATISNGGKCTWLGIYNTAAEAQAAYMAAAKITRGEFCGSLRDGSAESLRRIVARKAGKGKAK